MLWVTRKWNIIYRETVLSPVPVLFCFSRRYRVKKKWATSIKERTPSKLALSHFDSFCKPLYGNKWPSIRLGLLSQLKYCALINTFSEHDSVIRDLVSEGIDDILRLARDTPPSSGTSSSTAVNIDGGSHTDTNPYKDNNNNNTANAAAGKDPVPADGTTSLYEHGELVVESATDLHEYMPVRRVLSEMDELLEEEQKQSRYVPLSFQPTIVEDTELSIPIGLKAYAYPRGDVDLFRPPPQDENGKLTYYLMDAASLLPVIALNLAPGDRVLDLCAAPGGKTLAMLQTTLPGHLVSVDRSYSRLQRLKDVLRWYTPQSLHQSGNIEIIHGNGIKFCQSTKQTFDKILVDVPCYTDRHMVQRNENNLFRHTRMKERLEIQTLQKQLLIGSLQLLKPGGTAVYSTCTLSLPQNDGIIQASLEHLWRETAIDIAVVDSAPVANSFRDVMNFYNGCRYGQLVLPHVCENYGPIYFCKLRRLN